METLTRVETNTPVRARPGHILPFRDTYVDIAQGYDSPWNHT